MRFHMKKTCGLMANLKKTHAGLFPILSEIGCHESLHVNPKHKSEIASPKTRSYCISICGSTCGFIYLDSSQAYEFSINEVTSNHHGSQSLRPGSTLTLLLCSLLFEFALWPRAMEGNNTIYDNAMRMTERMIIIMTSDLKDEEE